MAGVVANVKAQEYLSSFEYDIEFHSYLANHVKHAIIALAGLGADDSILQQYWDNYTKETPYGLTIDKVDEARLKRAKEEENAMTEEAFLNLIGKKKEFSFLCNYLRTTYSDKQALVLALGPRLFDGVPGSLTHGVIHAGWGLAADNEWMIIEGFAYWAFAKVSVRPDRFHDTVEPSKTIVDSILRIVSNSETSKALVNLRNDVIADTENRWPKETFHPELVPAGFQWHAAKLFDAGHPIFYELPLWLQKDDVKSIMKHLYQCVSLLHIIYKGNFLVLHLITSLYGLENVLTAGNDVTTSTYVFPDETVRYALRCFWVMTLGLVATSNAGFPSKEQLMEAHALYSEDKVDDPQDPAVINNWDTLRAKALQEVEEHNIKLTFVSRLLWYRYNYQTIFREAASHFTDTPNINPAASAFKA